MTPAKQNLEIRNEPATLFRDGEYPIYVLTASGRFAVKWNGEWVVRRSLQTIEKLIGRTRKSLKLFRADSSSVSHSSGLEIVDVISWPDSNKMLNADGKRVYRSWGNYYLFDAQRIAKLQELEAQRQLYEETINTERERIMKGLRPMYQSSFEELLEKHGTVLKAGE